MQSGITLGLISPQPILIDTTPPLIDISYSFAQNQLNFICSDTQSGCKDTFHYQYVTQIKDFLTGITQGVLTKNTYSYCPSPDEPRNYQAYVVGNTMDYRYGDVRVICVKAEDLAGNAAVAAQVVYSTQDLLEAAISGLTEELVEDAR
ncbi:MAG: hypothetical protein HC945_02175 [Nitrosarchaeum sp.]|nr:hypothetical protein [Nitrosarchaeum sp.]